MMLVLWFTFYVFFVLCIAVCVRALLCALFVLCVLCCLVRGRGGISREDKWVVMGNKKAGCWLCMGWAAAGPVPTHSEPPWSFFTSFQAHSIVWRLQVHILHLCWNWIYPIWDWASQLWLLGWSECKILTSGWSVRNLDIIVCLPNVDHHLLRPIFYRLQNLSFSFACTAAATASNLVSVPKPIVGLQQVTWLAVLWKQKLWMNTKPLESLLTVPHLCLHCRQIDSGALNHQCADSRTSVGTFAYFALHLQLFVPF